MRSSTFLHRALTDSLSSGVFIDTKIYGFSRRKSPGAIGDLKGLYANSHVLRQISYFDTLLSGEFLEGNTTNIRSDDEILDRDDSWCGYSSDSDLEDDFLPDGKDGNEIETSALATSAVTTDVPSVQMQSSLPISIDSDDSQSGDPLQTSQISYPPESSDKSGDPSQDNTPESVKQESLTGPVHLGKIIVMKDTAFTTLKALVMYLYTGEIVFAPFGSEENRKTRRKPKASIPDYTTIPESSPKSIYRLADKCDIPDLRKLAYDRICATLDNCDIFDEFFCRSTSCYNEIRNAEVQYLAKAVLASPNSMADLLDKKIQSYAEGGLPHASEEFITLLDVLADETKEPELAVAAPVMPISSTSPYWHTLKTALNKSMTTGTFLDLQYYARSRSSSRMSPHSYRPIYFSRMMVNELFSKIEECTAKFTNIEEVDGVSEADSDFEDDDNDPCFKNARATADNTEQTKWKPTAPIPENPLLDDDVQVTSILKIGTVPTWKALLFYMYTSNISFAQLSSQGQEARITMINERHDKFPHQPKPCSPKSLYALARKLDLFPLRDLASSDIRSKISTNNIMTELFSKFTSSQPDVLEMEDDILSRLYSKSETANVIKEYIRSMSEGEQSHRSTALKFVFRRIIVSRKPAVYVRCVHYGCRHLCGVSSLASGIYCPQHSFYRAMACGACGYHRSTNTGTCLGCGARFRY